MGVCKLSVNKKGISTIFVLIILVAAVAVGAAGVYVMTKDSNNNDNSKVAPDDSDKTVNGKLGIGSKLYYDLGPRTAKTIGAVPSGSLVCEVIGEDSKYYYISITNAFETRGEPYILKMHKVTGAFDWAVSQGDGKWKVTLSVYSDTKEAEYGYLDVVIDIEVGKYEFGPMIASMTITSGKYTRVASINVAKSVLVDPSDYVAPSDAGKFISYKLKIDTDSFGEKILMDADVKTTVIGKGSAGKAMVLSEIQMSASFTSGGKTDSFEIDMREAVASGSVKDLAFFDKYNLPLPANLESMTGGTAVSFDLGGKQKDAIKYSMTVEGVTLTAIYSADKTMLYEITMKANTPGFKMDISIKCTGSNL